MKLHAILRLSIVALYVICFARRAGGPPLADEIDYIKPIEAWVAQGPQRIGLFHAPLYPWLESILGKLFSVTPAVLRLIGFAGVGSASLLLDRAARRVSPDLSDWQRTALLALSLLSPFALGSSLLLDYDTTVLVASTALYFYLLAANDKPASGSLGRLTVVFGLALALCLMSKETTPLVYPLGFFVLCARRFGSARAFRASAFSLVVGCAIFLATTWAWCAFYSIPLSTVFEMDTLGLRMHGGEQIVAHGLGALLWVKVMPVFWTGIPLAALFATRTPSLLKKSGALAAITTVVLAVLFAYTFGLRQMTYHFPKYMAPVLPWIAWLVIVSGRLKAPPKEWALGVLAWFVFVPLDPLGVLYWRDAKSLLVTLVVFAVPAAVWVFRRFATAPTLAVLLSLGLALSYCRTALISNGSITYWYGDQAIAHARSIVMRWSEKNPRGKVLVPAKDIAYATREYGSVYIQKDELGERASSLCSLREPWLVVTRIREDSSLIHSPQLERLRKCLPEQTQDVDIVVGSAYSQK